MSRLTGFRLASQFVWLLLAFTIESLAADNDCPPPAARPDASQATLPTQPRTLEPYSITQTVAHYYDAPLGLGYLEVIDDDNRHYYDWMFEIALPLWNLPDAARPLGWLMHGQVYTDTGVATLTGAGMVETDYEQTSFIVWETQAEWLQLRLHNNLRAWTHRCHLQTTRLKLEPVTWQTFFRRHADWLHFRKPVPHILRKSASVESERVTKIGLDHKLVLLDIRGDWMEVEVEQPDLTCSGPERDAARPGKHRGWVQWRDEQGPWVFVYTRGC
ncbi:MAG: hypothetical protein OEN20_09930 [Gammaproteobacteria bacterium]|nr:hypothetical protein [Gammaproteobacteria bacterium]